MAQHGEITHVEVPADDLERAQRFYAEAFAWRFRAMEGFPDYFLFETAAGREGLGGAVGSRGSSAGRQVRFLITVDSIDDVLPRIEELGGSLVEQKSEVPGQGWYAVITDPEGNELGLWEDLPATS